jgi:hypothetical protein
VRKPIFTAARICTNGPAIKGVCVTRRQCRAGSRYFSQRVVTAQGGYGAVFGVMVQTFWLIRVSRYNADRKQVSYHLIVILLTALVQCRVTSCQRSQEIVMLQNLNCEHWCGVRVVRYKGYVIESRKFKNRDKQMTFIVRVRWS